MSEFDVAVLAAIAYHQPITRDGLKDIFGKEISRDLIGRLQGGDLIGTGPRSPRRGASHTFVTTERFLVAFGLETLTYLPEQEQMEEAGLIEGIQPNLLARTFLGLKRRVKHKKIDGMARGRRIMGLQPVPNAKEAHV